MFFRWVLSEDKILFHVFWTRPCYDLRLNVCCDPPTYSTMLFYIVEIKWLFTSKSATEGYKYVDISVYNQTCPTEKKELLLIQQEEYDVIIARKLLHTPKYSRDARALMVTLQLIACTAKNAIAYLQRGTPEVWFEYAQKLREDTCVNASLSMIVNILPFQ